MYVCKCFDGEEEDCYCCCFVSEELQLRSHPHTGRLVEVYVILRHFCLRCWLEEEGEAVIKRDREVKSEEKR